MPLALPVSTVLLLAQAMPGVTPGGCPWLVSSSDYLYQPTKISPQRVADKNARGCLSKMDAIYGADGCPLRFCHRSEIPTP